LEWPDFRASLDLHLRGEGVESSQASISGVIDLAFSLRNTFQQVHAKSALGFWLLLALIDSLLQTFTGDHGPVCERNHEVDTSLAQSE